LTLQPGNGSGTFPAVYTTSMGNLEVYALSVADFNNDGKLDVVSIDYGGSGSPASMTILLQGTAVATPNSIGFGYIPFGQKSPQKTIVLTNGDTASLNISGFSITGTNAPDFSQSDNCPASLTSGSSCQIQVGFSPATRGIAEAAALQISDSGTGGRQTVQLSGHGTLLRATPNSISFGAHAVGSITRYKRVTITNTGQTVLKMTGRNLALQPYQPFQLGGSNCLTLAPGGQCWVAVRFSPQYKGSQTSEFILEFNYGTRDSIGVTLHGKGI
jgi:hypothetical protein